MVNGFKQFLLFESYQTGKWYLMDITSGKTSAVLNYGPFDSQKEANARIDKMGEEESDGVLPHQWNGTRFVPAKGFSESTLREGWQKVGNKFVTDAADIDHHSGTVHCPSCHVDLGQGAGKVHMVANKDGEHEITHWTGECPSCHAKLEIDND